MRKHLDKEVQVKAEVLQKKGLHGIRIKEIDSNPQ
jgi:hypothetical protein